MIAAITNTPRHAAWGSTTAIARLLGTEPSGGPEAELWFGAHPVSPASFVDPAASGGLCTLAEWASADGSSDADGNEAALPFLLKLLAAAKPLSLQAHPTAAQARAGFERENAAGIALDAPHRNYRDPQPKPELIVALSDRFDALAGFRPIVESQALLQEIGETDAATRLEDLPSFVAWLLSRGDGVDELVARVSGHDFADDETLRLVRSLVDDYPGDPGIVLALTLNRVTLSHGEALFVPAGMIHAYVEGLGIELMTASDNVLRGGLTEKHVDVPELLTVLDCTPGPAPLLEPERLAGSHAVYHRRGTAPRLDMITASTSEINTEGPAIALCTDGGFELAGQHSSMTLAQGDAALITGHEAPLQVSGSGTLFIASALGA